MIFDLSTQTLLRATIADIRARHPDRPALVGVGGAQGSGKSYQCRWFAEASGLRVAHFSLDDVYLTKAEREAMARTVHPLFITRGPPGTHDLALALRTVEHLLRKQTTPLPRFDKARDDRAPEEKWPVFTGAADAILVDGWFMGALPPPVSPPMNAVEAEDTNGRWRETIRTLLETEYGRFFECFDALIYLCAPDFDIVRKWRSEQEVETLGRPMMFDEDVRLGRFIQHYERITRAMIAGGHRAQAIAHLDESRRVVSIERRDGRLY